MSETRDLLAILDLESHDSNRFRGRSPAVGWQRIFGGLVISQALIAAMRTVDDALRPHSLHAYFILSGDPALPIDYAVDRLRDGRSFATRQVVARQNNAAIFTLSASFHRSEAGYDHQQPMPDVPQPEILLPEKELVARFASQISPSLQRYFLRERPIELRPVSLKRYLGEGLSAAERANPVQYVWFRAAEALPDDPRLHIALLAYASDMTLVDTALIAHGRSVFDPDIQGASLDHAMWFHRDFRLDDWLLYAQDSPSTSHALGLARGLIFTRGGKLIASVAQEGLLRQKTPRGLMRP
ncbi:MAG: acyl-CoA thioesterase II [Methylocystis sp.]|nr:acyl-CoA thioesterase II [Methylocystis sp.]MCA3583242.1 acyl-CoA thioesterase II [Methylocystis sp.]MCA3587553.1 acyl-CoA thioesterase II [Methylocystis sp.]MCA3590680.1 acyl-CoA thioesterase II [Methylocystis sp.]